MEIEEPGPIHFQPKGDEEAMVVMVSDALAERYLEIRDVVARMEFIDVALDRDFLPDMADQLISFLSVDLGPLSISLGLLGLVFAELCKRLVVRGYEIVRTPAVVGKAVVGKTVVGRGGYTIEPIPL